MFFFRDCCQKINKTNNRVVLVHNPTSVSSNEWTISIRTDSKPSFSYSCFLSHEDKSRMSRDALATTKPQAREKEITAQDRRIPKWNTK